MLLDEVALEQISLADRIGHDVLDVRDLRHHAADADIFWTARSKVGPHAAAQGVGLADVQDSAIRVLHEVHARPGRHPAQQGAQRLGQGTLGAHGLNSRCVSAVLGPARAVTGRSRRRRPPPHR